MPPKKPQIRQPTSSKAGKVVPFTTATNIVILQQKYFNAIYTRNISEINRCLEKGVNPNVLFPQTNLAPLHLLAERDDYVLGYRLMTASDDVDIEVTSHHGHTALHLACMFNSKRFAVMLLQMGANPNARNKVGKTPLHLAVVRQAYSIICKLIKFEANVNAMDCFENTPLSLSLVHVPNLLIATLLSKYADLEIEDTRISLHVFFECILVCHTLEQIDFVALLLDTGVNINLRDKHSGRMCLHFVAISGYLELAVYLVERGADMTCTDKLGRTPLKVAAGQRNFIVADYFQKGYRPPNLITVLPTMKRFVNRIKQRIAEKKEANAV